MIKNVISLVLIKIILVAYSKRKAKAAQKLKLLGKKYVLGDGYTDYEKNSVLVIILLPLMKI